MSYMGYRAVEVPLDLIERRELVRKYLGSKVLVTDRTNRAYEWSGRLHVPKGMRKRFNFYFLRTESGESRSHSLSDLVALSIGVVFESQSHVDSGVTSDELVEVK